MANNAMPAPRFFFAWVSGKPYITPTCGWFAKQVRHDVERMQGQTWKQIYQDGGRIIKCKVTPEK